MALHMDPAGDETRALKAAAEWQDREVLEIGCGDGRLTLRLASLGSSHIEALDPDPRSIRAARRHLPQEDKQRITYHVGQAQTLKYPSETFDIGVFAWSL
jgi:ubiquinone/menaquinone biosynthesis C-methylase UbiE